MKNKITNLKQEDLLKCIDDFGSANVRLFNKFKGVDIPEYLKQESDFTMIRISPRYAYPFDCTEKNLLAKLSFKGEYYECKIPWDSIIFIGTLETNSFCKFYDLDLSIQRNIESAFLAEIEDEDA
jgi:hypothetical protein